MRTLILAALLAGLVTACERTPELEVTAGVTISPTVLHRGNGTEPDSLDPHKSEGTSTSSIQRDLFDGLVNTAPDGSLEPGAAASWEVSDDRMTYLFRLQPDGRWSNGDPVTAQDFVFSFRRAADPATLSNYSQILAPILNAEAVIRGEMPPESLAVEALDERTLRFRLKGPTPYFLELLTHSMTYPVHRPSVDEHGSRFARPGALISNGAYLLDEWVVQSHVKLVKNPLYREADKVRIETVYFYPIESPATELQRYRAGELDWTETVPHQQLNWIRQNLPEQLHIAPYLGSYFLGFNVLRPPFANQPGLRRALSMVIDRRILTEKVTGGGEMPAYSYIPELPDYEQQVPEWASWPMVERVEKARQLYEEAGYGPANSLVMELRYNTSENHRRICLAIAAMWKQTLGVQTRLLNEEFKVFLENRTQKIVTEAFRAGWIGDFRDPYSFMEILYSTHGMNDTGYAGARVDDLIAASATEPDPATRLRMLADAERSMLEDQPIIPLFFYVSRKMVKPWVKGWQPNLLDYHPSRHIFIDVDLMDGQ